MCVCVCSVTPFGSSREPGGSGSPLGELAVCLAQSCSTHHTPPSQVTSTIISVGLHLPLYCQSHTLVLRRCDWIGAHPVVLRGSGPFGSDERSCFPYSLPSFATYLGAKLLGTILDLFYNFGFILQTDLLGGLLHSVWDGRFVSGAPSAG